MFFISIGDIYVAADGSNHGVVVVGLLDAVEDAVVMYSDVEGNIKYSEDGKPAEPFRIDYYKLTYRYIKKGKRDLSEKR